MSVESSGTAKRGPVADYAVERLRGAVSRRFLFRTVLGDDLIPFCARRFRSVLLPLHPLDASYRVITADESEAATERGLASWLRAAEDVWSSRSGGAPRMSIYQRLDYAHGLSRQSPSARYRVLYPNFQRAAVACVVDTQTEEIAVSAGFIADTATYVSETDDPDEAHYLCACLNAPAIDRRLTGLRDRAQRAHPNVHKKLFEVAPIPLYDCEDSAHRRLADIGALCARRVAAEIETGKLADAQVAAARRTMREMLARELDEIDRIVEDILRRAG